jgi:hypothetical protein
MSPSGRFRRNRRNGGQRRAVLALQCWVPVLRHWLRHRFFA